MRTHIMQQSDNKILINKGMELMEARLINWTVLFPCLYVIVAVYYFITACLVYLFAVLWVDHDECVMSDLLCLILKADL